MGSQIFQKRDAIYMHYSYERTIYLFTIEQITSYIYDPFTVRKANCTSDTAFPGDNCPAPLDSGSQGGRSSARGREGRSVRWTIQQHPPVLGCSHAH